MKLKAVTIKWLNAHLWDKLAKSPQDAESILASVKELLTQIENTHLNVRWLYSNPSIILQKSRVLLISHESQLPSSSVDYYSALEIFNLKEDTRMHVWKLPEHQIHDVPESLCKEIHFRTSSFMLILFRLLPRETQECHTDSGQQ